jgi:hypothetical protein
MGLCRGLTLTHGVFDGGTASSKVDIHNLCLCITHEVLRLLVRTITQSSQLHSKPYLAAIVPTLMNQPVRAYPLRPINEPAIYVMGEKRGQTVFSQGGGPQPPQSGGMGMNNFNPQAMLAQQNSNMEALERRREKERRPPPRVEDDDSAGRSSQYWA